jgi:hypothetical protein
VIDIENHSPFPHIVYEKASTRPNHFDVIVVAGTFNLAHGQPVYPADAQQAIVTADRYAGEPESSALLEETHLIVGKRNTDVHLIGHAKAPRGEPSVQWHTGLRVGPLKKLAQVTGPRWWEWNLLGGWMLTKPRAVDELLLSSALCYGGAVRKAHAHGERGVDITDATVVDAYAPNPVGKGYFGAQPLDRAQFYPAAQIEALDAPIRDIDKRYAPAGFAPRARWWPGRIDHAGTYDARWQKESSPYLPNDFDFAFYQSAQPELIAKGFLNGDEPLSVMGCYAQGQLDTYLPGITLLSLLTDRDGVTEKALLNLDTVTVNVDTHTVQLVWRKTVPKAWGLRHVMLAALPAGRGQPDTLPRPVHIHHRGASPAMPNAAPTRSNSPREGMARG